jgi:hypothetical protein
MIGDTWAIEAAAARGMITIIVRSVHTDSPHQAAADTPMLGVSLSLLCPPGSAKRSGMGMGGLVRPRPV